MVCPWKISLNCECFLRRCSLEQHWKDEVIQKLNNSLPQSWKKFAISYWFNIETVRKYGSGFGPGLKAERNFEIILEKDRYLLKMCQEIQTSFGKTWWNL